MRVERRRHPRRGAAGAATDLEDAQAPPGRQRALLCEHGVAHELVERARFWRIAVQRLGQFGRAVGKQDLQRIGGAAQHVGQGRPAAVGERDARARTGMPLRQRLAALRQRAGAGRIEHALDAPAGTQRAQVAKFGHDVAESARAAADSGAPRRAGRRVAPHRRHRRHAAASRGRARSGRPSRRTRPRARRTPAGRRRARARRAAPASVHRPARADPRALAASRPRRRCRAARPLRTAADRRRRRARRRRATRCLATRRRHRARRTRSHRRAACRAPCRPPAHPWAAVGRGWTPARPGCAAAARARSPSAGRRDRASRRRARCAPQRPPASAGRRRAKPGGCGSCEALAAHSGNRTSPSASFTPRSSRVNPRRLGPNARPRACIAAWCSDTSAPSRQRARTLSSVSTDGAVSAAHNWPSQWRRHTGSSVSVVAHEASSNVAWVSVRRVTSVCTMQVSSSPRRSGSSSVNSRSSTTVPSASRPAASAASMKRGGRQDRRVPARGDR